MTNDQLDKILKNHNNLERILDNIPDGLIAHDMNRKIFFFNKQAEKITGFKREDVLNKDCHEAMGGPFCGNKCSFCGENRGFEDHAEYKLSFTTKSGKLKQLEMYTVMMKDDHDDNLGILACFKDVTELLKYKIKAKEITSFANIVGRDLKMLDLFQQIRDLAPYDSPIHIHGETGTGKELVANAIHSMSSRKNGAFVPINCGALPEGLVESELFGHTKGSFSGAVRDKKGRFELAHKGTIFLDEVAELPKNVQVKLLRFLQAGSIEKVGSEKTLHVDTRIISATNKDLKEEVEKGNFRDDLYYRLSVIPISIPPLRERRGDIPVLAHHFLDQTLKSRRGKKIGISKDAISKMMDYSWPGNVRELENIIQFSIIKCKGESIGLSDLPMEIAQNKSKIIFQSRRLTDAARPASPDEISQPRRQTGKLDTAMVSEALKKTGGNKAKAARLLGVGRATLYRFLKEKGADLF